MNTRGQNAIKVFVCFLAAALIALIFSIGGASYFGLSETLSYVVFGATLAISYELITWAAFRER